MRNRITASGARGAGTVPVFSLLCGERRWTREPVPHPEPVPHREPVPHPEPDVEAQGRGGHRTGQWAS